MSSEPWGSLPTIAADYSGVGPKEQAQPSSMMEEVMHLMISTPVERLFDDEFYGSINGDPSPNELDGDDLEQILDQYGF